MTWQSMVFKVTRCYALQYNHRRRVDSTPYWPPSTGTVPITVPGLASRASGGAIAGSNCLFVPSHGPSPPVPPPPLLYRVTLLISTIEGVGEKVIRKVQKKVQ